MPPKKKTSNLGKRSRPNKNVKESESDEAATITQGNKKVVSRATVDSIAALYGQSTRKS